MYERCHLENAVQAWNSWLKQDINNIESVQKRAIVMCYGVQGTYEEKLKVVGLTTLCDLRRRGDMLQTFKIPNCIDDVDYRTWFTKIDEHHQKTRQAVNIFEDGTVTGTHNLLVRKSKLDIRKKFYSNRVVEHWNNLPHDVKNAENVQDFKIKNDTMSVRK